MAALINRTLNFAACRRFLQFSKKLPLHKCISKDTKVVSVSEALNSTDLIGSNVKIKVKINQILVCYGDKPKKIFFRDGLKLPVSKRS